jgi:hypothetical protein
VVKSRRLSRLAPLAVLAAAAWTAGGCGGTGCDQRAVAGLHVTILDGTGGAALCGATVIAKDGTYAENLAQSPAGGPCYYYGAFERAGVYTIEATLDGRTATLSDVRVGPGDCHVTPADVSIALPAALASRRADGVSVAR